MNVSLSRRLSFPSSLFPVVSLRSLCVAAALSGAALGLSSPVQAQAATAGAIVSEFRFHGVTGSADEYIELYNATASALDIGGWSVQYEGATALQTVTFPANTVVPARGHYLLTGAAYSLNALAAGDQTFAGDIADNSGLQLRNAAGTVVDAVAFAASTLAGEGTPLSAAPNTNGEYAFVRDESSGVAQDTGDNAADFLLVSTAAGLYNGVQSQLGAPGPQNLASPVFPINPLGVVLFDTSVLANERPNQVRVGAQTGPNAPQGTILFRRQLTNTSSAAISRLRVRVSQLTTLNSPGYSDTTQADLRMLSSLGGPRASTSQGDTVPVSSVTLEAPVSEGSGANGGGGINSSGVATDVTLNAPLEVGQSRNYEFLFRVVRPGNFSYALTLEAVIAPLIRADASLGAIAQNPTAYLGQNQFDGDQSGHDEQTCWQSAVSGTATVFGLRVANSGNMSSAFRVQAPASSEGFDLRYFDALSGGTEITSDVTSATGWSTPALSVGGQLLLRVEMTATSTAGASGVARVRVLDAAGVQVDAVSAVASRQSLAGLEYSLDAGATWQTVTPAGVTATKWSVVGFRALKADATIGWPDEPVMMPQWQAQNYVHVGEQIWLHYPNVTPAGQSGELVQGECGNTLSVTVKVLPVSE